MLHAANEALLVKHEAALLLSVVERGPGQGDKVVGIAHLREEVMSVGLLIACKSGCQGSHGCDIRQSDLVVLLKVDGLVGRPSVEDVVVQLKEPPHSLGSSGCDINKGVAWLTEA